MLGSHRGGGWNGCFRLQRAGRLRPLQETLGNLYSTSWEAEVILGDDVKRLIQPLEHAFKKLYAAIQTYFSTKLKRSKSGRGNPESVLWIDAPHRIIYESGDDKLSLSVDTAVTRSVRPIENPPPSYGWLGGGWCQGRGIVGELLTRKCWGSFLNPSYTANQPAQGWLIPAPIPHLSP